MRCMSGFLALVCCSVSLGSEIVINREPELKKLGYTTDTSGIAAALRSEHTEARYMALNIIEYGQRIELAPDVLALLSEFDFTNDCSLFPVLVIKTVAALPGILTPEDVDELLEILSILISQDTGMDRVVSLSYCIVNLTENYGVCCKEQILELLFYHEYPRGLIGTPLGVVMRSCPSSFQREDILRLRERFSESPRDLESIRYLVDRFLPDLEVDNT